MQLVIANIIALIASVLMVWSGYLKKKKDILCVQTIQIALFVTSNIILGGFTGAVINILSCIRNILCYKEKLSRKSKGAIILASAILSIAFNDRGFIGLLPFFSAGLYTLYMDMQDVIRFKYLIIITTIMWLMYDLVIQSYTSAAFQVFNVFANLVSIKQLSAGKREMDFRKRDDDEKAS